MKDHRLTTPSRPWALSWPKYWKTHRGLGRWTKFRSASWYGATKTFLLSLGGRALALLRKPKDSEIWLISLSHMSHANSRAKEPEWSKPALFDWQQESRDVSFILGELDRSRHSLQVTFNTITKALRLSVASYSSIIVLMVNPQQFCSRLTSPKTTWKSPTSCGISGVSSSNEAVLRVECWKQYRRH